MAHGPLDAIISPIGKIAFAKPWHAHTIQVMEERERHEA